MVRETTHVVQAFNAGKGRKLKAESPIVCQSQGGALRTAETDTEQTRRRCVFVHRRFRDG
jgi:hypothetical protein